MIRGEFSLVIIGLVGAAQGLLGSVVAACVIVLAVTGPILAKYAGSLRAGEAIPSLRRR